MQYVSYGARLVGDRKVGQELPLNWFVLVFVRGQLWPFSGMQHREFEAGIALELTDREVENHLLAFLVLPLLTDLVKPIFSGAARWQMNSVVSCNSKTGPLLALKRSAAAMK